MERFKKEIIEVCRKHNMYISHEDDHGSFLIVDGYYTSPEHIKMYEDWFLDADKDD